MIVDVLDHRYIVKLGIPTIEKPLTITGAMDLIPFLHMLEKELQQIPRDGMDSYEVKREINSPQQNLII